MPITALFYVQLASLSITLHSLLLLTLIMMVQILMNCLLLLRAVVLFKIVQAQIDLMAVTNAMIATQFYGTAQNNSQILLSV